MRNERMEVIILELLKCIKTVENHNGRLNNIFTKDEENEYIPISNR
jgi:hypothetical protein